MHEAFLGTLHTTPPQGGAWKTCGEVGKRFADTGHRRRPLLTDRDRSCDPFSRRRRRRSTTSVCVSSKGRRTWREACSSPPSAWESTFSAPLPPTINRHTNLGQLQGALVLDAVVGQGQPEQGAVQPQALRRRRRQGCVSLPGRAAPAYQGLSQSCKHPRTSAM